MYSAVALTACLLALQLWLDSDLPDLLSGLNGKRWSLVEVKKDAPRAPAVSTGTSSTQIFDSSGRLIDSSGRIIDQSGTRFPNVNFNQPQVIRSR